MNEEEFEEIRKKIDEIIRKRNEPYDNLQKAIKNLGEVILSTVIHDGNRVVKIARSIKVKLNEPK